MVAVSNVTSVGPGFATKVVNPAGTLKRVREMRYSPAAVKVRALAELLTKTIPRPILRGTWFRAVVEVERAQLYDLVVVPDSLM